MWTIPEHFAGLIALLRNAIGVFVQREVAARQVVWIGDRAFQARPTPNALPDEVWGLFWNRLQRLSRRFTLLYQRWQSGTLPKPHPHRTRARPAAPQDANTAPPPTLPLRLPRSFGWVNHRIPESAPPAGMLDAMLHQREGEVRAFLAAAPQAGRLLRPLCQALGVVQPDWLRLPPRPRRPRPPRPRRERPWRLDDPRLGLQPYVIAAVKAWRKKRT